jgi:uncharacterized membrane-anchored protein YhcB (DUF1043 family)
MKVDAQPQPGLNLSAFWPILIGAIIGLISWLANALYKVAVQDQLQALRADIDKLQVEINALQVESASSKTMLQSQHEMIVEIYTKGQKR